MAAAPTTKMQSHLDSPKNAEALQFMADLKLVDKMPKDAPGGNESRQTTMQR